MNVAEVFNDLPPTIEKDGQKFNWNFSRTINGLYRVYYGMEIYGEDRDPNIAIKKALARCESKPNNGLDKQ